MEAKIIPVFSNKGGVGKTLISVNLATSLTIAGRKTLLMDFDIEAGQDVNQMLGIQSEKSLAQLIKEQTETGQPHADIFPKYIISHNSGLDFLKAVANPQEISSIDPEKLKPFFLAISQNYEFIIIDVGQSFNELMINVLDNADLILLVATPDILAVYELTWCIKILEDMHYPLKMVKMIINRAKSLGGVSWQEVKQALDIDILGLVPSDGKGVGRALERKVPYVMDNTRGPIADAFRKIVNELKKSNLYIQKANTQRDKSSTSKFSQPTGLWDKLTKKAEVDTPKTAEDEQLEFQAFKLRVQKKLLDRLDLTVITAEGSADPNKLHELKETARRIVSQILMEETGAFISSHEERMKAVNEIINETFGLGVLDEVMSDPEVTDIMINGHTEIYVEKQGALVLTNYKFLSESQLRAIIDRVVAPLGRRIDEAMPLVDARLPDGSRFNAIIQPICLNGPCMTIRKFGTEKLTVDDIVYQFKTLSEPIRDFLYACVLGRMNIIISGGTGSGKTTLLNVLSQFIPEDERIITIEEAAELRLHKDHWCRLEARPANVEGVGEISLRDLFVNSLRMRPDRIVIGECRGPEVLDMLQAMNTGHDGSMTTLHANSTRDVLIRMSSMILLSGVDLPMRAIHEMLSSAINVIVHMARFTDGTRKITGITEITGMTEDHELILEDIFYFKQTGRDPSGKVHGHYAPCNYVPQTAHELVIKGVNIDLDLFHTAPVPI